MKFNRFQFSKIPSPKISHYSGIEASTLIELVQNTAPFLFFTEPTSLDSRTDSSLEWVDLLQIYKEQLEQPGENEKVNAHLWPYFDLCLVSHFATVGTFVPTDVDLAIRSKLWAQVHSEDSFVPMWKRTQEFLNWNEDLVSRRVVRMDQQSEAGQGFKISGHQGEWLSIAVGAYKTAKRLKLGNVSEVRNAIEQNVDLQEETLLALRSRFLEDGAAASMKDYLSGVAGVCHNLGDLDRQMDNLDEIDLLKRRYFKLGHEDAVRKSEVFFQAGKIYQGFLASENHRHFALREPKGLRKSSAFLLSYGPFLDDWGKRLVKEGFLKDQLNDREMREIIQALVEGWMRLNPESMFTSQGYARALAGIQSALPRGRADLEDLLPVNLNRKMNECGVRSVMQVTQDKFEKEWVHKILAVLEDSESSESGPSA